MKPSCIVTALFSSSERFDGYPPKNTFNGKTAKLNMKDHYPTTFRTRVRLGGEISYEVYPSRK